MTAMLVTVGVLLLAALITDGDDGLGGSGGVV